jgi:thiosulfate dehydrogenase [quinone] large subunit
MSVHEEIQQVSIPTQGPAHAAPTTGSQALAVLRITTGLLFLWAFLDKAFGLGYTTSPAKAWIHGGSPTRGFLGSVDVGPFTGMLHTWAGTWWANSLFMLGLLGLGVAVTLGVGLRLSSIAGTVLMLLMWIAEWPPARTTSAGKATSSSNPLIDYHVVYAIVLIVLAATAAGTTWGLARRWNATFAGRNRWLR